MFPSCNSVPGGGVTRDIRLRWRNPNVPRAVVGITMFMVATLRRAWARQRKPIDAWGIGGGGIRTPETLSRLTVFKTVAFSRSATPPAGRASRSAQSNRLDRMPQVSLSQPTISVYALIVKLLVGPHRQSEDARSGTEEPTTVPVVHVRPAPNRSRLHPVNKPGIPVDTLSGGEFARYSRSRSPPSE